MLQYVLFQEDHFLNFLTCTSVSPLNTTTIVFFSCCFLNVLLIDDFSSIAYFFFPHLSVQKYIDVDIYGACGRHRCPKSQFVNMYQCFSLIYHYYCIFSRSFLNILRIEDYSSIAYFFPSSLCSEIHRRGYLWGVWKTPVP